MMVSNTPQGYYAFHRSKSTEFTNLLAANGTDPVKARQAKNQLLLDNERFIRATIGQWIDRADPWYSEVLQEARIAFLTAVERYNFSAHTSIRTYAKWYINKERNKYHQNITKFQEQVRIENDEIEDKVETPGPLYFHLKDVLRDAMLSVLTTAEIEVISLHYFDGLNGKAIAAIRGCNEKRVSAIKKNALRKIKDQFALLGLTPELFEIN